MSRPLQPTELDEIRNLIAECEQDPRRLQRYFLELIRLRNVMRVVRSRSRLNPSVEKSIALNLPPVGSSGAWTRMASVDPGRDDGYIDAPELDLRP